MVLDFQTYKDKVSACWIGKNIGGTMGTPFEGKREMLDIKGFSTPAGVVLPNDDLDLQLVWLYAIEQVGIQNIDAAMLGEFWLNFIPPHWNEYGICKANMQRGLTPPLAGDYDNNWRDSNGAWIRTEVWACSAPGVPELAAKYSVEDAKVDHGAGEGTFAAAFVAAMQSAAFVSGDLQSCIEVGLSAIPEECRVASTVRLLLDLYGKGCDWKTAREAVLAHNKDLGDGWFEAPSNVGYTVLGLLWGEGDFKKSMITAINCGDDTDCTGATVGATLGILYGMEGIPADWKEYIGDEIVTISLANGCNLRRTIPQTCTELTERVVAIAPTVLHSYNREIPRRGKYKKDPVTLGEGNDIPENVIEFMKMRVELTVKGELESLKPYSMRFNAAFISANLTLDRAPEIAPGGEIGVKIHFVNNHGFENRQYPLVLRWILPDGFSAEGKRTALLQRHDSHNTGDVWVDAVIKAGDTVSGENRIVLEVTSPGRHTALYASFILFGL